MLLSPTTCFYYYLRKAFSFSLTKTHSWNPAIKTVNWSFTSHLWQARHRANTVSKYRHLTSQDIFDNKTMWSSSHTWLKHDRQDWFFWSTTVFYIKLRLWPFSADHFNDAYDAIKTCTLEEVRACLSARTSCQQSARDSDAEHHITRDKLSSSILSKLSNNTASLLTSSTAIVWLTGALLWLQQYVNE